VTATDLYDKPSNNSPQLAVDPTDSRFVVEANRLDAPFSCALSASGDHGRSWVSAIPVHALPEGADSCYGPEVAFDRQGTLYFLFVGLAAPGNGPMGVFLTTSRDRARSFSPPRQILGPERYAVRMAIDPGLGHNGRLHFVWTEAGAAPPSGGFAAVPNPILTAYSDDGGKTLSSPVQVSDPSRARAVAPALALGPHHAVHVLYYDLGADVRDYQGLDGPPWDSPWSLVVASSTDGGAHFGTGVVVDDGIVPPDRVMLIYTMPPASLVADRLGGLYAAWHDARNGDWDVFVRHSTDGGRTWAGAVRANDDPLHDGRHQYLPRLSVAPDGRLDLIFYDRRNNVENRGNDVYYTYSRDGGVTFAPNLRLTHLDSDSTIGPEYTAASAKGMFEFGSRLALVSGPSRVTAAWTDTRYTARAFPSQDIFGAEIDFPVAASHRGVLQGAGAVLAAGGIALMPAGRRRSRLKGGRS